MAAESPLFKRAFVRGINTELMRQGIVGYPTKEAADMAADYVVSQTRFADPLVSPEKVTLKTAGILVDNLIKLSQYICKEAGGYSPALSKQAASASPEDVAALDATALMEKAAAETGTLMVGGDKPNDLVDTAKENATSALENLQRPENYANVGERMVGTSEMANRGGSVGVEAPADDAPRATGTGSNTVIEATKNAALKNVLAALQAKMAEEDNEEEDEEEEEEDEEGEDKAYAGAETPAEEMLEEMQRKAAAAMPPALLAKMKTKKPKTMKMKTKKAADTGTLMVGGDTPNTLPASAQETATGALEEMRRPMGYAVRGEDGVGTTEMQIPSGAVLGREMPHPDAPRATGTGTNTVIEQTKNAFQILFEDTARQTLGYLPAKMTDTTKVAHVRAMIGLDTASRGEYLKNLYSSLGVEKTAAEGVQAHFLKAAADDTRDAAGTSEYGPEARKEMKEEGQNSKKEEQTDDERGEGQKEASLLLDRVKQMTR